MLGLEALIAWLGSSALNQYIVSHSYVWPTLESLHFIGLSLLFGAMLVIDLSVLGLAGKVSFTSLKKFVLVSVVGFMINLITGIGFIFGDPSRYFSNPSFVLKMLCVWLALLNAWYFSAKVRSLSSQGFPLSLKMSAGASLALWCLVLILGRFIPYVE